MTARRRARWQQIALFAAAASLGAATIDSAQLFRPFTDRSQALLEGNWQSCREAGGHFAERVYDGRWPEFEPFELHLGPFHEFALLRGIQDEHRDHASAENLLRPHTVELVGNNAKHTWDAGGLHPEVVLAGGSREDCESWFVTLKRSAVSSH